MDWLEELCNVPRGRVFVQHEPETPRYGRARAKLRYILGHGTVLGARRHTESAAVEVAVWAPPSTGLGHGYYACFRLVRAPASEVYALLFCFYDGTERSPGFRSAAAALTFARSQGFSEDYRDEDAR